MVSDAAYRTMFGRKQFADFDRENQEFEARKRERALKERLGGLQIQKAQQDLAFPDLERQAERTLLNVYQGKPLDDQGRAVLETLATMEGSKTQYAQDPYTGQLSPMTAPNQYRQFLDSLDQGSARPGRITRQQMPQMPITTSRQEIDDIGVIPMDASDVAAQIADKPGLPENEFNDLLSTLGVSDPRAVSAPDTQKGGVEDVRDFLLGDETAERDLQRKIRLEEEKAKLQSEQSKKEADLSKQMSAQASRIYQEAGIEDIDLALRILQDTPDAAGTAAGIGSFVKESPAGRLKSLLLTVQSGVGFDRLDRMRQSSPTGASGLGALSKPEMDLLQASLGELQNTTDPTLLARNLMRYRNILMDTIHGTPEQIQEMINQGIVSQNVADPLMQRYDLGGMSTPLSAAEKRELQRLREKYGR